MNAKRFERGVDAPLSQLRVTLKLFHLLHDFQRHFPVG